MYENEDPLFQLDKEENINKYKSAGVVINKVLDQLVKKTVVGASIKELCELGDTLIVEECNRIYNSGKNKVEYKGISYPTCISINNIAGNYKPIEDNGIVISEGCIVKIELGAHIDGFPGFICYTVIVNSGKKIEDRRADVIKAVVEASREIYQIMKPGKSNKELIEILENKSKKYNCNLPVTGELGKVPGTIFYQVSRYVIDGFNEESDQFVHKLILSRDHPVFGFTLREQIFEENEVYAIDILMSTGEGKLNKFADHETNIYKRNHLHKHLLKLKSSKAVLNMFGKEVFPISTGAKGMDGRTKVGVRDCLEKNLIEPYQCVSDKEGEYIARIKFTVIVKDRPILICGRPSDEQLEKLR